MNLTLYGSSLLRFEIDLFTVLRKIFQSFLKIKFESSHGLGYMFDFVSCIPDVAYVPMSNVSCRCLIDGLLTNQIALLLPVRGRTELCLGLLKAGGSFPPHPSPFLLTPSLLLPNLLAHPGRAPSLARI